MNGASLNRRLRAANPVPEAPTVEAPELYARIVAVVPSSIVRRRHTRRRLVIVVVVILAAIVLCTSAVLAIPSLNPFRTVPPSVTKKEYKKAQNALTLPTGYDWPALHVPANTVTSPGAGGGDAVLAAMWAWEDSWVKAIESGDGDAQQKAHEELLALLDNHVVIAPSGVSENWSPPNPPEGPYAVFADDGGIEMLRQAFSDAAAGHPKRLAQIVRANAPR